MSVTEGHLSAPVVPAEQTRAALRRAIVARNAAKERLRCAEQAEQRGRDMLQAAKEKLSSFGDVDALALSYRADSIKRAAAGGPSPNLTLPSDLVARRAMRDEAREHVAAANAAHDSLGADLSHAENELRKVEQDVADAAIGILIEEGARQASVLEGAWADLWQRYDTLNAVGSYWLPHYEGSQPAKLPAEALQLLQTIAASDVRGRHWVGARIPRPRYCSRLGGPGSRRCSPI